MPKKAKIFVMLVLVVGLLALAGCKWDYNQLLEKTEPSEPQLIKAEIYFTEKEHISAYIKSLGVEEDGQVYVGGASLNYLYDVNGEIIGSYNYTKVEYIKIVQ